MNSINSLFDHVYCINLDRRPDRWEILNPRFQNYGISVTRVPAVDGNSLPPLNKPINHSEIGCLVSHALILYDIISKGYKNALILEDDIDFADDWENKLFNSMSVLPPDWDMLYLGARHTEDPTMLNDHLYKVNCALTTSSYAITAAFAEKILPEMKKLNKQVDLIYSEKHKEINAYATKPCLIWQRGDHSDVLRVNSCNVQYFKMW